MSARTVRIRSVEPLDGFVVRLSFTDGTFEPLRADRELFRQVRVDEELGTIVWPNGAHMDPDVLHGDFQPADTATTSHASHAKR